MFLPLPRHGIRAIFIRQGSVACNRTGSNRPFLLLPALRAARIISGVEDSELC